jgi:hypothetical protein
VIIQPMVLWLWVGGGIMAFGTVLAAWPGRRRRPTDPVSAPIAVAGAGPDGPPAAGGPDDAADRAAPAPAPVGAEDRRDDDDRTATPVGQA